MQKRLNIAFIGLGERGRTALRLMSPMAEVRVAALCDTHEPNVRLARSLVSEGEVACLCGPEAYKQACQLAGVDLVYVCSDWSSHAAIALAAMHAGKHVAVEVPAALTTEELRELVATSRATGRECFMLENCCFDEQTLAAIAAIHRGDIGEVVHAEGTYYHDLAGRWAPWRLEINRLRRGDLYPTHAIGPICMALRIGTEDRMATLVSMDSAPVAGPRIYERTLLRDATGFAQGDHTTTLIRTQRGRTILIKHDVATRQPYERQLTFIGTKGRISINDAGKASHEAMTRAMNSHLVEALLEGKPLAISAQDMAAWCSLIPLSQQSISLGFAPVAFPDFKPLSSSPRGGGGQAPL